MTYILASFLGELKVFRHTVQVKKYFSMESNTMLHVLMLHLGQRKAALPVQEIKKNTFFFLKKKSKFGVLETTIW